VAYTTDAELLEELLTCEKKLIIVPVATHLFEEPGTLEQVAEQAGRWFQKYLTPLAF
jgi:putative phosphoribosyl transferase